MSDAELSVPVGPADHALGRADAPLTLVEYGDYQCPYCGQAQPVVESLIHEFGDDLRFVFRNLPLTNIHPQALHAAEAAEAVALQDRFWPMHDLLFAHQHDLSDQALIGYAEEAGADLAGVEQAVTQHSTVKRIEGDVESALRSGANGTPSFFVNGKRYDKSWDRDTFADHLRTILN